MRPTIADVQGLPDEVSIARSFQPATPSAAVSIPSITADHALAAALPGGEGADITPGNVINVPTLASSGGDKGSTL